MTSEMASTCRQIGQEIRAKELVDDFYALLKEQIRYDMLYNQWWIPQPPEHYGTPLLQPVIEWVNRFKKPHGHTLASIRRFKGF